MKIEFSPYRAHIILTGALTPVCTHLRKNTVFRVLKSDTFVATLQIENNKIAALSVEFR